MKTFRISKYNPKYRTKEGEYLKKEWTSISDINNTFDDGEFTINEYINVENHYIEAIDLIIKELKSSHLKVVGLEKFDEKLKKEPVALYDEISEVIFNNVKEGNIYSIKESLILLRLIIRENLWCYLVNKEITIKVGYDFYIEIIVPKKLNCFETIENKINLFIEPLNLDAN